MWTGTVEAKMVREVY